MLAAIAALPPGQRDAVALFYFADLSHAQISARLGISTGAVKTRLHKARASLQTRLADLRREHPAMPSTVPMHVADIRDTAARPASSHVVLLEEDDGARRLPIWIGAAEATTLAARLHGVDAPAARHLPLRRRPADAAGARLREVRVVPARRDDLLRRRPCSRRRLGRRAAERRDQPRARGRRAVLVEEAVLAQAAGGEREIGEELAAALASPRDAARDRRRAQGRATRRMSGRTNRSPRITGHTSTE